jgi:adenosine 3'-phospho 5'-phosphosulfate transporter B2
MRSNPSHSHNPRSLESGQYHEERERDLLLGTDGRALGGKSKDDSDCDSDSASKSKKTDMALVYKGLYCFFGLQVSYLTWGMMQELIMTTKFEPTPGAPDGMFPSPSFCVFSNRFLAIIIAYVVCLRVHGTVRCSAPAWAFLPCAISNTTSSWAQYSSLQYVSFPLQNIFKSTKVIPVMLMGMVLKGATYSLTEYFEAGSITSGVLIFSMTKNAAHGSGNETSTIGVILLIAYVCADSFTSQWQSRIYRDYGE